VRVRGEEVSPEAHRFARRWIDATTGPRPEDASLETLVHQIGQFYYVESAIRNETQSVPRETVERRIRELEEQFPPGVDFARFEGWTGYSRDEFAVEACRAARLEQFARISGGVGDAQSPGDVLGELFGARVFASGIEVLTSRIPGAAKRMSASADEFVVEARPAGLGLDFRIPSQTIGDASVPDRTADHLLIPAGMSVELVTQPTADGRTVVIPEWGARWMFVPGGWRYRWLRVDSSDTSSETGLKVATRVDRPFAPLAPWALRHVQFWSPQPAEPEHESSEGRVRLTPAEGVAGEPFDLAVLPAAILERTVRKQYPVPGEKLYDNHCAQCHGTGGRGRAAYPGIANTSWVDGSRSPEELARVIVHGSEAEPLQSRSTRSAAKMPKTSGLAAEEVVALIEYLQTVWGDGDRSPTSMSAAEVHEATGAKRLPKGWESSPDTSRCLDEVRAAASDGDCDGSVRSELEAALADPTRVPEGAERLFERAGCAACHGRGDGPPNSMRTLEPRPTHFSEPATWSGGRTAMDAYRAIMWGVPESTMGHYTGELTREERWNLARYVTGQLDEGERRESPRTTIEELCRSRTKFRDLGDGVCWGLAE